MPLNTFPKHCPTKSCLTLLARQLFFYVANRETLLSKQVGEQIVPIFPLFKLSDIPRYNV